MVGLIDLAPGGEEVKVRGQLVSVPGVSAAGFASLLFRFPALQELMSGKEVDAEELKKFGIEAVAAIIAAGTGTPGDLKAETAAAGLPIGEQLDLLAAILRVTLPEGIGPFVEKLHVVGGLLGSATAAPASS